jgi:hypothetical protein
MSQLQAPVVETRTEIHGVVAEFESPQELVAAIRAARERGYGRLEAYTPFPVHGVEEAIGLRRSKLGWIVLCAGLAGAAGALLLQWWTGAVAYPLRIGGKPLFAVEPSIPITFELTVLFAAFGAVLGMLALNGLPRFYHPVFQHPRFQRATDDRFLLAIEARGDAFAPGEALEFLRAVGGKHAEVVEA